MNITQADYNAILARRNKPNAPAKQDAVECEAKLHAHIIDECRRRCWYFSHGSMAQATARTIGEPDFIIAMPGGRTLWVECKSRTGKLTREQEGVKAWLEQSGHMYVVVRSLREFVEAVEQLRKE